MTFLPFTLFLLSSCGPLLTSAGSVQHNGSCNLANNRLQAGTFQFTSDCDSVTFCSAAANNTCQLKGCRKDDFPFGYSDPASFPDKCARGTFCPDEADQCLPWVPVGGACQLNRDDECEGPPNFAELADTSLKGLNVNGSVCLNNTCYYANVTEGDTCIVENTPFIAYTADGGEFIDIVSRGNCRIGNYCDSQTLKCVANKALGETCDADKECDTYNCLGTGVCGVSSDSAQHLATWVYIVVGIAIVGGMIATLVGLFFIHRRHRDQEREKRVQYWREQNAFHQNLLQMRETARASLLSVERDRHDGAYSDESVTPMLNSGAPKGSGLRYMSDEGSEYDEAYMMQAPQQTRMDAMGRF